MQVDSRLHFATSPLLIPGGQHGEEEKESSGEEDETSEEEVVVRFFEIFDGLSKSEIASHGPASVEARLAIAIYHGAPVPEYTEGVDETWGLIGALGVFDARYIFEASARFALRRP